MSQNDVRFFQPRQSPRAKLEESYQRTLDYQATTQSQIARWEHSISKLNRKLAGKSEDESQIIRSTITKRTNQLERLKNCLKKCDQEIVKLDRCREILDSEAVPQFLLTPAG